MHKVINRLSTMPPKGKKEEGVKKKEQNQYVCTYSQYRARVREFLRQRGWTARRLYDEAGVAADEIVGNCFGTDSDRRRWSARLYEYPWAISRFLDTAYEKASLFRSGDLRNPVTAFQAWVNREYPSPKTLIALDLLTKGGAR